MNEENAKMDYMLAEKTHIWINYKLKGRLGWKNADSLSISLDIFLLACIYLLSPSVNAQCHQYVFMKQENNYILSGSAWRQAMWTTDWPLFQGEGTLWAFDWPLPEERLSINDWLGSVIFHLNGCRGYTLVIVRLWQETPLYCKCVNVSFLSL